MGCGDFCLNWCDSPLGLGASCERRGGAKGGAPAPSSFPRHCEFRRCVRPGQTERVASAIAGPAMRRDGGMGRQMPGLVRARGIGMPPRKRGHAMTVAVWVLLITAALLWPTPKAAAETDPLTIGL